ncbi:TIGR02186 family protein [Arvimicrobium flavum]|uniref:TIGR02186 family protein n=1 Tax=Arvimicrobium flavum TaxID=3393320 RepID=UPI00237BD09B|nr:TIGR02186 family protein [Mesorhizobium shangrilense]
MVRRYIPALLAACALLSGAFNAVAQAPNPETIEIGLSTDHVMITAGFSGTDLTIFGAIDNADPLVSRQGRYDVIVVLEGPARPVVVRKKERVGGVWINLDSYTFLNVPMSYSVATTRPFQDVTDPNSYRQLALGAANIYLQPSGEGHRSAATIEQFTAALRQLKQTTGLYSERVGGVQFLSQTLFRATLPLSPNVPVGTHRARAFLFKSGVFVRETSAQLAILKSGFEQRVYDVAHQHSFLYGVFAVVLAMLTGWLGRIVFRKD